MDCGQKRKCLFKHKNNASCKSLDASCVLLFLRTSKWIIFTNGNQYPRSLQFYTRLIFLFSMCYWLLLKNCCPVALIYMWLFVFQFFRYREYFNQSYQETIQDTCFVFCVIFHFLVLNKYSILQNHVGMKKKLICLFKYIYVQSVTLKKQCHYGR